MITLAAIVLFLSALGLLHLTVRAVRGVRGVFLGATPGPAPIAQAHHI
jgi:hypothetical protein